MKIAVERGEGHCFYSIPSLLAYHSCFHALDFHLSPPVTGAHNTGQLSIQRSILTALYLTVHRSY